MIGVPVIVLNPLISFFARLIGITALGSAAVFYPDVFLSIFRMVIDWLVGLVNDIGGVELPDLGTAMSALPPEMIQMMKRIRMGEAFSIILLAATFRVAGVVMAWLMFFKRGAMP